ISSGSNRRIPRQPAARPRSRLSVGIEHPAPQPIASTVAGRGKPLEFRCPRNTSRPWLRKWSWICRRVGVGWVEPSMHRDEARQKRQKTLLPQVDLVPSQWWLRSSLPRGPEPDPAVDSQRGAGDVIGVVGGEERGGLADILGRPQPAPGEGFTRTGD